MNEPYPPALVLLKARVRYGVEITTPPSIQTIPVFGKVDRYFKHSYSQKDRPYSQSHVITCREWHKYHVSFFDPTPSTYTCLIMYARTFVAGDRVLSLKLSSPGASFFGIYLHRARKKNYRHGREELSISRDEGARPDMATNTPYPQLFIRATHITTRPSSFL